MILELSLSLMAVSKLCCVIPARSILLVAPFLSIKEALYAKDAFAKAMYEQLFAWIFIKINQVLDIKNTINQNSNGYQSKANNVIGVLDIYGFEIFDANG